MNHFPNKIITCHFEADLDGLTKYEVQKSLRSLRYGVLAAQRLGAGLSWVQFPAGV